jgi:hypothetical protein
MMQFGDDTSMADMVREIERLRAALKPFAVPDKTSLAATLGHITREHIANARAALKALRVQHGSADRIGEKRAPGRRR